MVRTAVNTPIDNLIYERECLANGVHYIAGIDEVGRGPLAGNVVCAAVIMPLDDIIIGITDSKKLSEKKRNHYNELILNKAIAVSIAEGSPSLIDEINILQATRQTMLAALDGLSVTPEVVLVDAMQLNTDIPQQSIIKGDLYSYTIACASIVAKVYRDKQITEQGMSYPQYEWASNKGYGSAKHMDAIRNHGATPLHRRSFIGNIIGKKGE